MTASLEAWAVVFTIIALLGRIAWFVGSWFAALAAQAREQARMLKADNDLQAAKASGFDFRQFERRP